MNIDILKDHLEEVIGERGALIRLGSRDMLSERAMESAKEWIEGYGKGFQDALFAVPFI